MPSATPADVLAERRRLILSGDADGFADLFAPDAVIEAPFAPPGAPARLEGREAIHEYSRRVRRPRSRRPALVLPFPARLARFRGLSGSP
jgi:ketosteroid isomerase-like protein